MTEQKITFGEGGLKGWLFSNAADEDSLKKKKPGLIICHGFPSYQSPEQLQWAAYYHPSSHELPSFQSPEQPYRSMAQRIHNELGWQVLIFNYRGCGSSPGNFSMAGWLEDTLAAVEYLKSQALEIWLAGFGMGGQLAINCASKVKEVAGVLTAGAPADFSDWAENSTQLLNYSRQLGIISDPDFPSDEASWKQEFAEFQVEKHKGELSDKPLLVIHGSEDAIVPTLDARAIAESQSGAEIRIMEGVTHQLRLDPRVLSVILGWLSRQRPTH